MKKWIAIFLTAAMMASPVCAQEATDASAQEAADASSMEEMQMPSTVLSLASKDGKTQKLDTKISTDAYEIQLTDLYIENGTAHVAAEATVKLPNFDPANGDNITCFLNASPSREDLEELILWQAEGDSIFQYSTAPAEEVGASEQLLEADDAAPDTEPRMTDAEVMADLKKGMAHASGGGAFSGYDGHNFITEMSTSLDAVPEKLYVMVSSVDITRNSQKSYSIADLQSGKQDFAGAIEISQRGAEVTVRQRYTQQEVADSDIRSFYPLNLELASGMIAYPIDGGGYSDDTYLTMEYVFKLPAGDDSLVGAELTGVFNEHLLHEEISDKTEIFEIVVDSSKVAVGGDFKPLDYEIESMDGTVVFDSIQQNPYTLRLAYFLMNEIGYGFHYDETTGTYYPRIKLMQGDKELSAIGAMGTGWVDYEITYYIEEYLGGNPNEPIEIMVLRPDKTYDSFIWTPETAQ